MADKMEGNSGGKISKLQADLCTNTYNKRIWTKIKQNSIPYCKISTATLRIALVQTGRQNLSKQQEQPAC
jgi:hypothetical protein